MGGIYPGILFLEDMQSDTFDILFHWLISRIHTVLIEIWAHLLF